MRGDGERFGVHDRDVGFVLDIDVDLAFAVAGGLFGRAAEIDGAGDGAVGGVDHGRVGRAMAEDPHAIVEGVVHDAVGAAVDVDGLDEGERFRIEHGDRLGAGESMTGFGGNGCAARVGVGNLAEGFERVEIVNGNAGGIAGARDVQLAAGCIGVDVIESAGAADFGGFKDFVGPGGGLGAG